MGEVARPESVLPRTCAAAANISFWASNVLCALTAALKDRVPPLDSPDFPITDAAIEWRLKA